jgi:glyoxylase-like metal-dependent hydrolase (beta-lactamase superfamily II)
VIETEGRTIVVDPAQAADDILRGADAAAHQDAFAAALEQAGFAREAVDTVIASHLDGIGMIAWRDGEEWAPFFPHARVVFQRAELDAIDAGDHRAQGMEALAALRAAGCVDSVDERHDLTGDVTLEWTGAHSPGHQIARVESAGERAVFVGHLALNPLHCVVGDSPLLHGDTPAATKRLAELRDSRALLVGPLWPTPGAARWDGVAMNAVETPTQR